MLAHGKWIREQHKNARIIFAGPCISKKHEHELNPAYIDGVITFGKLKDQVKNVATNSARCAHYMVRGGMGELVGQKVMGSMYGSSEKCINAAISGKWGEQ